MYCKTPPATTADYVSSAFSNALATFSLKTAKSTLSISVAPGCAQGNPEDPQRWSLEIPV
jgi:hypothetical protein